MPGCLLELIHLTLRYMRACHAVGMTHTHTHQPCTNSSSGPGQQSPQDPILNKNLSDLPELIVLLNWPPQSCWHLRHVL
eukprot:1235433-Amphidinium_carterae.2